jgi:uncharacterized protein YdaU (DUF1376 family)
VIGVKAPSFQFYPGDWLRDTQVLSATARGAWISILVAMWDRKPRGHFSGSVRELSRVMGTSEAETEAVLVEFECHDTCDLKRDGNGFVTLVSRRMVRDEKERGLTRVRVKKHRACNADVTPVKRESTVPLHSSSSSSGTSYLSPPTPIGGVSEGEIRFAPMTELLVASGKVGEAMKPRDVATIWRNVVEGQAPSARPDDDGFLDHLRATLAGHTGRIGAMGSWLAARAVEFAGKKTAGAAGADGFGPPVEAM